MTIPSPRLDDRSFEDLYGEAIAHMRARCPDWRGDLSPGDPAAVLIDVFAHLTEVMLYRVNRLPEKVYVELLRLVGVRRRPPAAAVASLELRPSGRLTSPVRVPRGTRVSVAGEPRPRELSFVLIEDAVLQANTAITPSYAIALACDLISGELIGVGTGEPGRRLSVARPPIIAPPPLRFDESRLFLGRELVVGVEADAGEPDVLPFEAAGKRFRRWYESETFSAEAKGWPRVYRVDRLTGEIELPPAALLDPVDAKGGVPAVGREIRAWYARGGGASGNVGAGRLSLLVDPVPGVSVTNPDPASGGADAETLAAVMLRAPEELVHRDRAVTASDYEKLAKRASPAVRRVYVYTPADVYADDRPGAVRVLLALDEPTRSTEGASRVIAEVASYLDERRPLGSACEVALAPSKQVTVGALVVAAPSEDPEAVRARVEARLSTLLAPTSSGDNEAWEFGRTLHASAIYEAIASVSGVRNVAGEIVLGQSPAPMAADALEADPDRPRTFYLGSGSTLYRSENDGLGWEASPLALDAQETIVALRAHPEIPQSLALVARAAGRGSRIFVSDDGGKTFPHAPLSIPDEEVRDIAWDAALRVGAARTIERALYIASSGGLRRARFARRSSGGAEWYAPEPLDIGSDRGRPLAIDSLASLNRGGKLLLAATSRAGRQVYFGALEPGEAPKLSRIWPWSSQPDRAEPWCAAFQRVDGRVYLWMGSRAEGHDQPGCRVADVTDPGAAFRGFAALDRGWRGGTCTALAARGDRVFAATATAGVLEVTLRGDASEWSGPRLSPTSREAARDLEHLTQPLVALAVSRGEGPAVVIAGGERGIVLRHSEVRSALPFEAGCYHSRRYDATKDFVTLPRGGLFASAAYRIEVVRDA